MQTEVDFQDMLPAGLVYCNLPPEMIYEHRKKRISKTGGNFTERGLSDAELHADARLHALRMQNRVQVLQKMGLPVLEISMTESIDKIVPTVLEFIRRI